MEKNMFEDIVAEGNIVVIDNDWIVLCKCWKPECYNLLGWLPTRNVLCFLRKCLSMELLSISTSII